MTTNQLPTRRLGSDGPVVSRLALGTMTFGVETSPDDAFAQLDAFVAAGGTLVDTADVYGDGASERIIGSWLADRAVRDDVVLATKGRFGEAPGASADALRASLTASRDRLGVDAVDLYLVHGWDQSTPVEETLATLSGFVEDGHVRHVGFSNVTGWQLATIVATARHGGFVVPCVVQPQHNLLDRGVELDVLPACLDLGLSSTPWSPLGGGWLTGKYERDERPTGATRLGEDPGRGVEAYDVRNTEHTWRVLDVVREVAAAHDRPMAQVAIAWLLHRPTVASVLLGARTPEQLVQTLDAIDLVLSADELAALTRVSAPGLPPYPHAMVEEFCDVPHWRTLGVARSG